MRAYVSCVYMRTYMSTSACYMQHIQRMYMRSFKHRGSCNGTAILQQQPESHKLSKAAYTARLAQRRLHKAGLLL